VFVSIEDFIKKISILNFFFFQECVRLPQLTSNSASCRVSSCGCLRNAFDAIPVPVPDPV
jgi:hypothetical protein